MTVYLVARDGNFIWAAYCFVIFLFMFANGVRQLGNPEA